MIRAIVKRELVLHTTYQSLLSREVSSVSVVKYASSSSTTMKWKASKKKQGIKRPPAYKNKFNIFANSEGISVKEQEILTFRSLANSGYPYVTLPALDTGLLMNSSFRSRSTTEDVLKSFQALALKAKMTLVDWQVSDVKVCLTDITEALPRFSDDQLVTAVRYLALIPSHKQTWPQSLFNLANQMDGESEERLKKSFGVDRTDFFFHLAFLWSNVVLSFNKLCPVWQSSFLETLSKTFLDKETLKTVSGKQFVFLMFLSGVVGKRLNVDWATVENKMEQVLPELNVKEVGIMIHSVKFTSPSCVIEDPALSKKLCNILSSIEPEHMSSSDLVISSITKGLDGSKLEQEDLIKLSNHYADHLNKLNSMTITRLGDVIFNRVRDSTFIDSYVMAIGRKGVLRVKDMLKFVIHLSELGISEKSCLNIISGKMEMHRRLHPNSGIQLVILCATLAKLGVFNKTVINEIFQAVNQNEFLALARNASDFRKAGARILFELSNFIFSEEQMQSMLQQESNDPEVVKALFSIGELDCLISLENGYSLRGVKRLKGELRKKLIPFGKEVRNEIKGDLYTDIQRFYPKTHVYYRKIQPHLEQKSIILATRPLSSTFLTKLENDIVFGVKNVTVVDFHETGLFYKTRQRHLEKCGFSVISIHQEDYQRAKEEGEQRLKTLLTSLLPTNCIANAKQRNVKVHQ